MERKISSNFQFIDKRSYSTSDLVMLQETVPSPCTPRGDQLWHQLKWSHVSDITLLPLESQKASYNFCHTCRGTIQHLYYRLWCVKSAGKNNSLPLALRLLAQLLPGPKPSEDSGEPLLHPNSPHLLHFSSETEAAGQTLYLAQSASVGSTTKSNTLRTQTEDRWSTTERTIATRPTCRFLTLSETFSWDMLWSRPGSAAGSSGMKMLSCERARDPMGFNSLQTNESVAVCHYCQSLIHLSCAGCSVTL